MTGVEIDLLVFLIFSAMIALALYFYFEGRVQNRAQEHLQQWKQHHLAEEQARIMASTEAEFRARFREWRSDASAQISSRAIERSRAVIVGKVSENIAPILGNFPYNPKDARFVGSPIDFVVFDGLDEGAIREVILVEVKTSRSALSNRQRAIRAAVNEGRVSFEEFRITPRQNYVASTNEEESSEGVDPFA